MVSQRTSFAVLGLDPAAYLARVKVWGIPVVRDGKLVLSRVLDWDRAFEQRRAHGPAEADPRDARDARLEEKYGLRRVGGGRR